jgi:uncharacterized protein (DUF58 family)
VKPLRQALDWGTLAPLRLRARSVADGIYAGGHRSPRRGAGVEFGGHRSYVPGDDLRFIDRHAMMRHGQLLVREFETETDRALRLIVDASGSMAFKSERAPGAKYAFAAVIAAALARIAVTSGDRVALDWISGSRAMPLPAFGGREAFERIVNALETAEPAGDVHQDLASIDRALAPVARQAGRGAMIVLFSDLIDLPARTADSVAALSTRGRTVVLVRVLDPVEIEFPFEGPVHLQALEGPRSVVTDATLVRKSYLEALEAVTQTWQQRLVERGGRLVRAATTDDPVDTVRKVLGAVAGDPA